MGRRRKMPDLQPITESVMKRIAYIMGPQSGAQGALDDAEKRRARGEEVAFYISGQTYFVGPPIERYVPD